MVVGRCAYYPRRDLLGGWLTSPVDVGFFHLGVDPVLVQASELEHRPGLRPQLGRLQQVGAAAVGDLLGPITGPIFQHRRKAP